MLLDELDEENKKAIDKSVIDLENKIHDYKHVFLNEIGQRVFGDLQIKFNTIPSYEPGANPRDMCYLEGQKSVIHYIYSLLTYEKPKEEPNNE